MDAVNFGFIGLGLIGGSLALNLRKIRPGCRIMANARTKSTLEAAKEKGIIDTILESPDDPALAGCDVIFLCAPVENNIRNLELIAPIVKNSGKDILITDVGSVKTGIHAKASQLGLDPYFVGGHPMTGSEQSGIASAKEHLFENAYYILTPTEQAAPEKTEFLRHLASALGSIPLVLAAREHDYITAAISHLPHVIAAALVNTVHNLDSPKETMKLIAAGGFKDITRIASSSPEMWEQICVDNHQNISEVMDEFIRLLTRAREQMNSLDGAGINEMFRASREYRDSFSSVSMGPIKKTYRIYCDIIDESGAIATIATILAVSGINIKNISIVHNRDFEEGVLRIEFYEAEPAAAAAKVLRAHRYQVWEPD